MATLNYYRSVRTLEKLKDIPLLLTRLVLAFGFYTTARVKWADIGSVTAWFRETGIPAPAFNAYLTASTEALGVVLLISGLGTRIIAVPLMIMMLVAIGTVHLHNGFEAGDNGFEIPLYYLVMLLVLFINGAGRFSLDRVIDTSSQKLKKEH